MSEQEVGFGGMKIWREEKFFVAHVRLPRKVPHLIVRSKQLSEAFSSVEIVSNAKLGGDFDKVFDVKVPEGYHVDALQLLTPDVMHAMLEYGERCSFELDGEELEIIIKDDRLDINWPDDMKGIKKIVNQIIEQVDHYRDARTEGYEADTVAEAGKVIGTSKGKLIFSRVFMAIYVVVFLLAIGLGDWINPSLRLVGMVGVPAMLLGLLLLALTLAILDKVRQKGHEIATKRRKRPWNKR